MQKLITAPTYTLLAIFDRNNPRNETVFNFSGIDSNIIIDNIDQLSLDNELCLKYDDEKVKRELGSPVLTEENVIVINSNKENTKYMTLEIFNATPYKILAFNRKRNIPRYIDSTEETGL